MRVKLFVLLLVPEAIVAGWLMFACARALGKPLLVQPQPAAFVLTMTMVFEIAFGVMAGAAFWLLGLAFVRQGGAFILVDPRSPTRPT